MSSATLSPHFLRVPTLGDRIKAIDTQARVVAVSGKDRAAIMMAGHDADLVLWWNGKAFDTYANRVTTIPTGMTAINAHANAVIAHPAAATLPNQCLALAQPVAIAMKKNVGVLQPLKPGDERAWRASPAFDASTLDAALLVMHSLRLGKRATTDVLAISFSATDYVGHSFGTEGAEMCTQILALDQTLARLFAALDKYAVSYAVVLTADHGGHDLPERNAIRGLPAAERVDPQLAARTVGNKLAQQSGFAESVLIGRSTFGDMYLSAAIPLAQRAAIRAAAVDLYRTHRQVAAVFTRDELLLAPTPSGPVDQWTLLERARAGFDAERSGDFVVLLKPYVTPIADAGSGYVATHGSPWDYDRRVPILFWWHGIHGFEQPNAVETVDILPTLASLLGLAIPAGDIDGRCLDLLAGIDSNCATDNR